VNRGVLQVGGWLRLAIAGLVAVLATGCNSNQAITNPATGPAREINTLWWAMFAGAMVVFGAVVGLLVLAFVRRHRSDDASDDDRGPYMVIIGGGLAAPIVFLAILFGFVIHVMPATSAPPGPTKLTIEVIGHQWFWEVRYHGTPAVTANEIHIPAATPVDVRVTTADVIHSFWVPRLNRKIDMIPGQVNRIELDAPDPGVYRGQCSEFCGVGHAQMAFDVIVQPPGKFRAWLRNQAAPATQPPGADATRGQQAFMTVGCQDCHAIRGTPASGRVGPDLTHVGSRRTLAALTIPNTPRSLYDWITNPQRIKPGARMPGFASLPASERHALVTYLEGLR
jgi:cytochrome c oxidase subunit II